MKKFRNNAKIAEIIVARLHSSKRNVERRWGEKDLGFLQDHAVIWLVLGQKKVIEWVEKNFFSLTVFGGNLLSGDVHSSVTMDGHFLDRQHLPTHLRSTLAICLLTWGLGRYSGFPTTNRNPCPTCQTQHYSVNILIDIQSLSNITYAYTFLVIFYNCPLFSSLPLILTLLHIPPTYLSKAPQHHIAYLQEPFGSTKMLHHHKLRYTTTTINYDHQPEKQNRKFS